MNPNRNFENAKKEEENVAWILEYITGRNVCLMPEYCPFDFIVLKVQDGVRHLSSIVEYRGRPGISKARYPTVVINCEKVKKISRLAAELGVENILFIVKWADTEPEWVSLADTTGWRIEQMERRDQERQFDRKEPVYHIPTEAFRAFR